MSGWTLFKPRTSGTSLKGKVSVSKGGLTELVKGTYPATWNEAVGMLVFEPRREG